MPGAGAGAGADQQLVVLAGGDDLVDQRIDGRAAAVDHALPADLDHRGVRQDAEVRRRLRRRQKLRVGQRPLHQERFELRCCVCHDVPLKSAQFNGTPVGEAGQGGQGGEGIVVPRASEKLSGTVFGFERMARATLAVLPCTAESCRHANSNEFAENRDWRLYAKGARVESLQAREGIVFFWKTGPILVRCGRSRGSVQTGQFVPGLLAETIE